MSMSVSLVSSLIILKMYLLIALVQLFEFHFDDNLFFKIIIANFSVSAIYECNVNNKIVVMSPVHCLFIFNFEHEQLYNQRRISNPEENLRRSFFVKKIKILEVLLSRMEPFQSQLFQEKCFTKSEGKWVNFGK